VAIVTPDGLGCVAEITEASRERMAVRRIRPLSLERPDLSVSVYQCVPKGRKLEQIVQDCTELGVSRLVPVVSARTIVRWDAQKTESRVARLRDIATHAAEQSGCAAPVVETPVGFEEAAREDTEAARLLLDTAAGGERLGALIGDTTPPVDLLVGPEGGLTDGEVALARECGWVRVSLGPRTLRTETAAVAALAIIMDRWGDRPR